MPLDKGGKFHLNTQRAMASDKMAGPPKKMDAMAKPEPAEHDGMGQDDGEAKHTTLHDHGDGTFHTEGHDGEKMEHPHIGHALMHMAGKHGGGGKHMHAHHDGMGGITSHQHSEEGGVEGGHDHENIEALKDHLGQFFNEEEQEGGAHASDGAPHEMADY